jgi:hypothetical protein
MKRRKPTPKRKPVALPIDLHADIAEIGKRHTRSVGQQAVVMLRKAVFEEVVR